MRRFPEIRFNGDFSHWYSGHDLPYGDFEAKLDVLAPVLERTRYLHGRVGTGGTIQVDVGDGPDVDGLPLAHFRALWTRSFAGFIATALDDPVPVPVADNAIGFAPELPAEFGYAVLAPDVDGELREIGDRWDQALVLTRVAADCFTAASAP